MTPSQMANIIKELNNSYKEWSKSPDFNNIKDKDNDTKYKSAFLAGAMKVICDFGKVVGDGLLKDDENTKLNENFTTFDYLKSSIELFFAAVYAKIKEDESKTKD